MICDKNLSLFHCCCFFKGKKACIPISPKNIFNQTKTSKWQVYVTNHVTYFSDGLTELGLKIDTSSHELPLVVTANLNEIEYLYHQKTSDCIKACDKSFSSLFWPWSLGPVFCLVCLWHLCLLPYLLYCLLPCLWPHIWPSLWANFGSTFDHV